MFFEFGPTLVFSHVNFSENAVDLANNEKTRILSSVMYPVEA